MSKIGENIYKRKDGRWEGRYIKERIDGKIRYGYVFADSLEEAREKRRYAMEFNDLAEVSVRPDFYTFPCPFSAVSTEWFENLKPQLKESSVVKYRNILNSYLLPKFGEKNITEIMPGEIRGYLAELMDSGGVKHKGLSAKTTNGILSVLKLVIDYARQVKGYGVITLDGIAVKQTQKALRILSQQEQRKLDDYLRRNISLRNLGILICLYSGMRLGEICALKWKDILMEEQTIHIHNTMLRLQIDGDPKRKTRVFVTTPKTDCSVRKIPVPDDVFRLIAGEQKDGDVYFLTGLSSRFVEPRTMENHFKSVTGSCGIADANFHSLRHTFATRCVELGFDVKSLSEILGHASVSITMNRYVHPSMEVKKKNMNRLSEIMTAKK
ncbi:MAG: site-specific integrase [Lachnospiraceae bacterium]|nr:site-specific integrase [Lachnospiraceae bacterium]